MDFFTKLSKYWNLKRIINNVKYFVKYDFAEKELDIIYKAKDGAVEDCVYELEEDKIILKNLFVLDEIETFNSLQTNPKSFARFGDGEISIIQGKDCNFQKYDPVLAKKLLMLLQTKRDDIYVALNRSYFHSAFNYSENNHRFYRLFGTEYRRFFINVCDPTNIYLDACCFGGYFRLKEDTNFDLVYERNKNLFRGKKLAIVAGEGLLSKLQYDVFEYAEEKIIIPAPSSNAFSKYDDIIREIETKVPKNYIVCLILGQTATVMVADLTDKGYLAWDIGHLPKDYNAYMNKMARSKENLESYWKADL